MYTFKLTDESRKAIESLILDVKPFVNGMYDKETFDNANTLSDKLPSELVNKIEAFLHLKEPYLWLENLPQINQDVAFVAIINLVGGIYAYINEGTMININRPKPHDDSANIVTFYSWNLFEYHTEKSFATVPPDFLALYCIQNVPGAATLASDINTAVSTLDKHSVDILSQPLYKIKIPEVSGCSREYAPIKPILFKDEKGNYTAEVRFDNIVCYSDEAKEALEQFRIALNKVGFEIELKPGQMVIINNKLLAHGRKAFTPTFNATSDRELHRVFIARDVAKLGKAFDPNTRKYNDYFEG